MWCCAALRLTALAACACLASASMGPAGALRLRGGETVRIDETELPMLAGCGLSESSKPTAGPACLHPQRHPEMLRSNSPSEVSGRR